VQEEDIRVQEEFVFISSLNKKDNSCVDLFLKERLTRDRTFST